MKKTLTFFIIILSLISLLSLNVFSVTENFIALAQESKIEAFQCSIIENTIKIGNTGNINSLYSIKQEGDASKWSIIRPKSFSLDEKKIKNLMNPINVPCDAKTGEYELLTYIESAFGLKKVINQRIIVEKQPVVEVEEPEEEEEEVEVEEPEVIPEINETADINDTADGNESAQSKDSTLVNILKWISYLAAGIVVIIIVVIIILYNSDDEKEPSLENMKKVAKPKKATAKKAVKKVAKKKKKAKKKAKKK